jgi:circadian clock protein KaiB
MSEHKKVKAKTPRQPSSVDLKQEKFILRLFVAGTTPKSMHAIQDAQNLCEEHLGGRYQLEVIDIYQLPELARDEQIIAVPTLVKHLPLPLRKLVGDLSNSERVLIGLDLLSINDSQTVINSSLAPSLLRERDR